MPSTAIPTTNGEGNNNNVSHLVPVPIPEPAPNFDPSTLPDASSPSLILTHPTPAERARTWRLTHPMWGPALTEKDYLAREAYLTTVPLARNGGITHWILTVRDMPPDARPVLSSCESIRKKAISVRDGKVTEGVCHGIASVFTDPVYRGRGYASRMMSELGRVLKGWQAGEEGALFSVLYSDIGKQFYAKHGWAPFESSHVAIRPRKREEGVKEVAVPIGYHELAELACVDERLLRKDLASRRDGRTHVALLPELDAFLWHMMREDFMTKCIFGRTPTVRGAVAGKPGQRVWAIWMRGYYGGLKKMEGNTLHVLRVVVEDENRPNEELVDGLRSIIRIAQHEAAEWFAQEIHVWNPPPKVKFLIEKTGIEFEFVNRDKDSIASLMWYSEGPAEEVNWVANEKYAWC
ncbi:N-acetyltransferase-like protein [Thermochaetoides thermophila DSM 1495]|uniref:N-acetyltransferase-like protein n=1 Tax=Chaetomium thermophilum (strain DSM 1495 / CBS 144.50 / IMI 039719) TaxID=759272 RepID=G0S7A1_CHATD|nr:N-acetyltransferase-like protein [Thermochaetoides thermophila DSM 1495]EGS21745.1 N-acetyltransferase-like protein [Thermochaetoides thermophila DSM 1495]